MAKIKIPCRMTYLSIIGILMISLLCVTVVTIVFVCLSMNNLSTQVDKSFDTSMKKAKARRVAMNYPICITDIIKLEIILNKLLVFKTTT